MKVGFRKYVPFLLLIVFLSGAYAKQSNIEGYEYLTQDYISLTKDVLEWNGEKTSIDEIKSLAKSAYSLHVRAYDPNFSKLMAVLKVVKDSEIEDQLIMLNLYGECVPEDVTKANATKGEAVSYAEFAPSQFSKIYEDLCALPLPHHGLINFMVEVRQLVQIEAEVVEFLDDGSEKKLSSPKITTKPGNVSSMGVRDTQPEIKNDPYQQNNRSGGGVSFKVLPQFIGDYIKLTGSISLKRTKGAEAFTVGEESIHNYSTETITIPIAYVFDKSTDSVEFDPIEVGGKKIVCRLQAFRVSDQGKRISFP